MRLNDKQRVNAYFTAIYADLAKSGRILPGDKKAWILLRLYFNGSNTPYSKRCRIRALVYGNRNLDGHPPGRLLHKIAVVIDGNVSGNITYLRLGFGNLLDKTTPPVSQYHHDLLARNYLL